MKRAPELALNVPHIFVFPVAQRHFDGPGAIMVDVDLWFKNVVTFENVIRIIGREFLGKDDFALWIFDDELAFVLPTFVRRSKTHNPGTIHRGRYLVDF